MIDSQQLPPDPENMNDKRAMWAKAGLDAFKTATSTDPEDALADLLADLMHWCDRSNMSFRQELQRACCHYDEETAGQADVVTLMQAGHPKGVDPSDIDIGAVLKQRRQIGVIWSIEDVQGLRSGLTDDQAWEVLQQCERRHDCELGITLGSIEFVADDLFAQGGQS